MQFLGHTRFSLFEPESSSWRLSRAVGRKSTQQYLDELYSPERLTARMEIFLGLSLPLLNEAKRNHHLVHVVSYSEELPDRFEQQLLEAAQRYDWLRLDKRTQQNRGGKALDKWALENFPEDTVFAEYRLDDDDLLSVHFFDSLAHYGEDRFVGFIVSHGYGVQAFYTEGAFREPRLEHRPKIAIGLARVCRISKSGKISGPKRVSHTRSDRVSPVILDSRSLMFLHSFHLTQDSGIDKPDGDLGNRLRNYLNLPFVDNIDSLSEQFPGVPIEATHDELTRVRTLVRAYSNGESLKALFFKLVGRLSKLGVVKRLVQNS